MKLRIMSNNIWKCDDNLEQWKAKGLDCSAEVRAKGFANVYKELNPDIIGIQEASGKMMEEIMENLSQKELNYALLWGRDTPILYRPDKFELIDSNTFIYPEELPGYVGSFNNEKTKSWCIAVFRIKETQKLFIFATTHLWWKNDTTGLDPNQCDGNYQTGSDVARAYQIKLLLSKLDMFTKKYACPVIVCGDFNANYHSLALKEAFSFGYLHAHDIATEYKDEMDGYHFCGYDTYRDYYRNPFECGIDHFILKNIPANSVYRFNRLYEESYLPLSDHSPVWIDIKL